MFSQKREKFGQREEPMSGDGCLVVFFLTLGEVLEGFLIYIDDFFQIKVEQKIMIVS